MLEVDIGKGNAEDHLAVVARGPVIMLVSPAATSFVLR